MSFEPPAETLPFGDQWLERPVTERFEYVAARFPDRLAIQTGQTAIRYAELNREANRLAHQLLALRGPAREVVAILHPDTVRTITAMLGIAKSGKCYLPLDGSHPVERLRHILDDSGARILAIGPGSRTLAESIAGAGVRLVDLEDLPAEAPATNPGRTIEPDDPFMMLYTSGSTGTPKGIQSSHRARMMSTISQNREQQFTSNDRLLLLASPSVNAARGTIYYALLNGASLHPYHPRQNGLAGLSGWIRDQAITVYHSTPTLFRSLAEFLGPDDRFPAVHLVRLGGEAVLKIDHEIFKRHFSHPDVRMRISYASGETGNIAFQFIDRNTVIPGHIVPVGFPSPGREVLIRDEYDRPVPEGELGEIIVRSRYTAQAYWDRPALSSEAFVEDPDAPGIYFYRTGDIGRLLPDGQLLLVGRKDGMVKIRGYRVELAEVEGALMLIPEIREAAVTVVPGPGEEKRLAAYYVTTAGDPVPPERLRESLAEKLPDYAVPYFFIQLDEMPVNAGGKIDRLALPAPAFSRPDLPYPYTAPRSELEAELAAMWADALGIDRVGVEDGFFDLGGHSLLATRIIARVLKHFKVEIPYADLLESQTVAAMAVQIAAHRDSSPAGDVDQLLSEIESLSDEEVRRLLEGD